MSALSLAEADVRRARAAYDAALHGGRATRSLAAAYRAAVQKRDVLFAEHVANERSES